MAGRRRRVAWTLGAQDALTEALEFIAEDSADGAWRVLRAALNLAESLATLSERGRIVPEYSRPEIREVFVYSYRLMYKVDRESVTIIAFVHGAIDFGRWIQREL